VKKPLIILVSVVLLAVAGVFLLQSPPESADASMTMVVYKSPTCGCCHNWVELMEAAGYTIDVRDTNNMNTVKMQNGVARNLQSCHTALIDGYLIEGHVPVEDIQRLLAERPAIKGLAVPGMPIGSPGMEQGMPSDYQSFDVVAFDGAGNLSSFRHVEGGANGR